MVCCIISKPQYYMKSGSIYHLVGPGTHATIHCFVTSLCGVCAYGATPLGGTAQFPHWMHIVRIQWAEIEPEIEDLEEYSVKEGYT